MLEKFTEEENRLILSTHHYSFSHITFTPVLPLMKNDEEKTNVCLSAVSLLTCRAVSRRPSYHLIEKVEPSDSSLSSFTPDPYNWTEWQSRLALSVGRTHTHTAMAVQASILRCDLISYWVLKCLFVCEQTKRHPVTSHHFFLACLAAATENKRDCSHKHVQINMNPKKQNNTFVQVEQMINLEKIKTNCVSICSNICVQTCQDTTGLLIMLMSLLPSRENSWHWGVFVKRLNSCLELQSSWFPEDEPYCLQLSLIFTSLPKSSKF